MNSIDQTKHHWFFFNLRKLLTKYEKIGQFWKLSQEDIVRIKSWLKNVSSSNRQNQARRKMKITADLDQVFLGGTTLQ